MAINSSSPVAGALAAPAKISAAADAKSKVPGFAPGTPVYPPERLPPQPRGAAPQNPTPGPTANARPAVPTPAPAPAVAADAPATRAADPRAPLPANIAADLAATAAAATTPASTTAQPAASAQSLKPRPKPTTPPQSASPAALTAMAAPLINNNVPTESAQASEPADSAAPVAADATRGAAAVPVQIAADLAPGVAQFGSPRGPASGPISDAEADPASATPGAATATDPSALPAVARALAPPVKFSTAVAAPTDGDPQPRADDTSVSGGEAAPDPSVLGAAANPERMAAEPPAGSPPAVQTPVGASGWTEEVGTHVIWMAHQGISSASLRLQPEHLGPLEVRISLHDSTASVWFGANEPETRTALQAALPQLKEMFAAQGMTLTDAGVSREPPRDAHSAQRGTVPAALVPAAVEADARATLTSARRGLIDTYA